MKRRKIIVGSRQTCRRVKLQVNTFLQDIENSLIDNSSTLHNSSSSSNSSNYSNISINDSNLARTYILNSDIAGPSSSSISYEPVEHGIDPDITSNSAPTEQPHYLRNSLVHWTLKHNVSHSAVTDLLHILAPLNKELPKDCRTLLKTPLKAHIKKFDSGDYCHIGLECNLIEILRTSKDLNFHRNIIQLSFNIDGLPLFHSKGTQLWPILCQVKQIKTSPFVVGIFCGMSKPKPLETYLEDTISELIKLQKNGLVVNETVYTIMIHSFICDAPAKAYIKMIKSHGGYSSCDKCFEIGEFREGKVILPGIKSTKRTDISFLEQIDEGHHLGISPLVQLNIGMVSNFPIDYMHCVCLGVTKKIITSWIKGNLRVRLGSNIIKQISDRLESFKSYIPSEFNRKPRSLSELARWKATEFRTFLVYVGPIALKGLVDLATYEHFLLLHSAITILLSAKHISNIGSSVANEFLEIFIKHCKKIYGVNFFVYNVHMLCHLKDDVDVYGPLDNFSAFEFENFLGKLKRLVRSPKKPLEQIVRRLHENLNFCFVKSCFNDTLHLIEHTLGPTLPLLEIRKQYKKVKLQNLTSSINSHCSADSYLMTKDNKVIEIQNIIITAQNRTIIIGKPFKYYHAYYKYPIDSQVLNIYRISNLDTPLIYSIEQIKAKCILIPESKENWICFPLIHDI